MILRQPVVTLVCFLALTHQLLAVDPDFEIEKEVTFEVDKTKEGYTLESEVKVWHTYLTDRSTGTNVFPVSEPFYGEVKDISGRYEGYRVDKDDVAFTYLDHEDIFISNNKVYWVEFPDEVKPGDQVTYGYEVEYDGAAWFPIEYVPAGGTLKRYRLEIRHPKEMQVDFRLFFPRDSIPYEIVRTEEKTMLVMRDVPPAEDLDYFPFNGLSAAIQVRLVDAGTAVTPTTPQEFTGWYRSLFTQSPTLSSADRAKLAEVVAGKESAEEKLQAIHDFVRTNIRYIADEASYGAIIPRDPSLVLSRGYGDCKDRAYLVAALAREHGIDVDMALVATDPSPSFENGVFINQFNHVICAWNTGDRTLFFDPTHKYIEFGALPASDVESVSLVLDPESPKVVVIPPPNDEVAMHVRITASVGDAKNGEARVTLRNSYLAAALRGLDELKGVDLENLLSNLLTSHFHKISLDYFQLDTIEEGSATFTATADLSDYLITSTKKAYVPALPLRIVDADVLAREKDTWPIWAPQYERIRIEMILDAAGYAATEEKLAFGDENGGTIASSIARDADGRVVMTCDFAQKTRVFEGESKQRYLAFCREFLNHKKTMFTLAPTAE